MRTTSFTLLFGHYVTRGKSDETAVYGGTQEGIKRGTETVTWNFKSIHRCFEPVLIFSVQRQGFIRRYHLRGPRC